jgi:hypothetical protein
MNNELFDRMIKENLQEVQVAPSAGVKKVLVWKLFFQNMLVFHKVKVALGLLFVSTASTVYFVETSNGEVVLEDEYFALINPANSKNITTSPLVSENETVVEVDMNIEKNGTTELVETNNIGEQGSEAIAAVEENSIEHNVGEENSSTYTYTEDNDSAVAYVEEGGNESNSQEHEAANETHTENESTVAVNAAAEMEHQNDQDAEMETQNEDLAAVKEELFLGESKGINLESEANLNAPQTAPNMDLGKVSDVYAELSFDLYKGVMGKSELSNYLTSAIHRQYSWDFYGPQDVLTMNVLGGVNANYTFGSQMFRVKASAGISHYTLSETKANYEFEEITDPAWLNFFNTDELAWVNTYGEDTCTQCFYAHNTEELQTELEQDYNKYSYLKVPLQLGAQFNFKYFSFDVLGGVDMNFLTNCKGIFVKEGLHPNYERFYYWDDLQLSTLSKHNEMLKKTFMTWSVAANVRVRVSKNFDVLAGYQINKSIGNLTNDAYIMDKSLKSSNATVGITFYPFRSALKPSF